MYGLRFDRAAHWMRTGGKGLWVLASVCALGVIAAPLGVAATGDNLREAKRNPLSGGAKGETEIIANVSATNTAKGGYGTRQSNLSSSGGAAIYGCRSAASNSLRNPCLRANNLSTGLAFEFNASKGDIGGLFSVGAGGDSKRPFVTNATGVATGLNADRVDGLHVAQIIAAARAAGGTGAKGDKGDPGAKGDKGDKGDPGAGGALSSERWGVIGRNTLGSPSAEFRVGPNDRTAADDYTADEPPPSGVGSLGMIVDGPRGGPSTDAEKLAFGNESDFGNMPVADLTALSYSIFAGVDSLAGTSLPGLAIEVDRDSTNPGLDYTQLVYLPNDSTTPSAPATPTANVWQDYDAAAAGSAWKASGTTCTLAIPCTFDALKTALGPNAVVSLSLGFTKGRDNAFVGAVDALRVNGDVYDFEPGGVVKTSAP